MDRLNNSIVIASSFEYALSKLKECNVAQLLANLQGLSTGAPAAILSMEKLTGNMEPFYSMRLNKEEFIIFSIPEDGIILIAWIGKKEAAYDWAATHTVDFDPFSGRISILKRKVKSSTSEFRLFNFQNRLFSKYNDEELLSLGLSLEKLSKIRSINDKEKLWEEREYLPTEIFERLIQLAEGVPIKEIVSELKPSPIPKNWHEAIKIPQRDVIVWENEPVENIFVPPNRWKFWLHPVQKAIVNNPSKKPFLLKGAPGTGKTVVAMQRAVRLVKEASWNPDKKLLYLTPTEYSALDVKKKLAEICAPEELQRIEVTIFDKWLRNFLKQKGIDKTIVYPSKHPKSLLIKLRQKYLQQFSNTTKFKEQFIRDEWHDVILPNNIITKAEYLKSDRYGSTQALSSEDRKTLWPIFKKMRKLLKKTNSITQEDANFIALDLLKKNPLYRPYDTVIVDGIESFPNNTLKVLAELAIKSNNRKTTGETKNKKEPSIFLVGNGLQKICSEDELLKDCGIDIRGNRTKTLRLSYITTEEIRKFADSFFINLVPISLEEYSVQQGMVSNRSGDLPVVKRLQNLSEEVEWLHTQIQKLHKGPKKMSYSSICIVARNREILKDYKKELEQIGYATTLVLQKRKNAQPKDRIRLATTDAVKELEFEAIFLVGAQKDDIHSTKTPSSGLSTAEARKRLQECSAIYNACLRARENLFVSSSGEESDYMFSMEKYLEVLQRRPQ